MNGIIVVDLPSENIGFSKKCKKQNICFVQLISPTTTINRAKKIIKKFSWYDLLYIDAFNMVESWKFQLKNIIEL